MFLIGCFCGRVRTVRPCQLRREPNLHDQFQSVSDWLRALRAWNHDKQTIARDGYARAKLI